MREIRRVRMANRALYAVIGDDKTMDMVEQLYAQDPELAKRWHLQVLENDVKILALTRELVGDSRCE